VKVGVTGTQKGWTERQRAGFTLLIAELEIDEFHHGDCVGVDEQAAKVVGDRIGYDKIHSHPPKMSKKRAYAMSGTVYEPKDYMLRNDDIVAASDFLIVVPLTEEHQLRSGTWATFRRACKAKKRTRIIFPNGSYTE